jgi:hypothetical protein
VKNPVPKSEVPCGAGTSDPSSRVALRLAVAEVEPEMGGEAGGDGEGGEMLDEKCDA